LQSPSLKMDDLAEHVVTFGMDIYPLPDIAGERTRLNMFYEEASRRWPELYEQLQVSDREFMIYKYFGAHPELSRARRRVATFALSDRGPVFVFPLVLTGPAGVTGLESQYLERFEEARKLFFSALPERKILRLGLVRDVVFGTGQTSCLGLLRSAECFGGAKLARGNCLLQYRDSRCNVGIRLEPVELTRTTQLAVGTRVEQREAYGLRVRLDVNNSEIRALEDGDIKEILDRAGAFWPDQLLEYLEERRPL
jgi:hypothetical protein